MYYDKKNKIVLSEFYQDGLIVWRKEFDTSGNLLKYFYEDFANDTIFYFDYIDNLLFKKVYYAPIDKNIATIIYYPNEHISISNAEPFFYINFITSPKLKKEIILFLNENEVIDSIVSQNSFLKINDAKNKQIKFPLYLKKNTKFSFNITAIPIPSNYCPTDTIQIFTKNSKKPYSIYCTITANHLNYNSVETTDSLTLSKSTDKFLFLPRMGTSTVVTITSFDEHKRHYNTRGIAKIDLSEFELGTYKLLISGCNSGGKLTLIIKE